MPFTGAIMAGLPERCGCGLEDTGVHCVEAVLVGQLAQDWVWARGSWCERHLVYLGGSAGPGALGGWVFPRASCTRAPGPNGCLGGMAAAGVG